MIDRLLDSVVLIDHFNNIPAASSWLSALEPEKTAISVISYAEILVGIPDREKDTVKALLHQYTVFAIDIKISELAADLRKQYRWKLPDSFQAAIAMYYRIRLVTRNTKDFDPEKHSFVEVPYSI